MWQWLRRSFVAGFFVTVPLFVSVLAIVGVFRFADTLTGGLSERVFGMRIPGVGVVATAIIVLATGALATNLIGRRLLQRTESLLLHVPVFRTVYAPIKQLVAAFSPDNEMGFKRVVLIEDAAWGARLGFLTREFGVDRGHGPESLMAVYVPTNHLYLGDVVICRPEQVTMVDLTVEQGVRVFLTGGVALPSRLGAPAGPKAD
jgi:uncharacterized membrane protein